MERKIESKEEFVKAMMKIKAQRNKQNKEKKK